MNPLRIGLAKRAITPPLHLPLDGYDGRAGVAQGVLDPLLTRALYLSQDHRQYCIASLELLGVSGTLATELRQKIASSTGIPPDHIIIAATHTHSGPAGLASPACGTPVLHDYLDHVIEQVLKAASEAQQRAVISSIQLAAHQTRGLASNRIDPSEPIDTHVRVFSFVTTHDGKLHGMAIHYACHPTVLGEDNLYYSGDFVGRALQRLERDYDVPCLFLLGAAADVSTRFTRVGRNCQEMSRLAGELVAAVKCGLSKAQRVFQDASVACAHEPVRLTKRRLPLPTELAALLQETATELRRLETDAPTAGQRRKLQTRAMGVRHLQRIAKTPGATEPITTTLVALRLGEVILVAIPGEVFQSTATGIVGYGDKWLPITLANGYQGYFPTTESIARHDYESLYTTFDNTSTAQLTAAIERLVTTLGRDELPGARHHE